MNEVGRQIRKIREKKKLTLEELANKIGKTNGYLSKLETGKKPISLKNLQIIADALGVDIIDFFPDKEKVKNPFTGEEDWFFVIEQLKAQGFTPGDVFLKFAQEAIEKDKKNH